MTVRSPSPSSRPRRGTAPRRPKKTQAERADIHACYEKAVQDPVADLRVFEAIYRDMRGRKPMHFHEDFCGTAWMAYEWVKSDPKRTAVGVDLDGPTLEWGRQRRLAKATKSVRDRLSLIQGNVLEAHGKPADILVGLNFSWCVFHTREDLVAYFRAVHSQLAEGGLFFIDVLGGTGAHTEDYDDHERPGFTYRWEQAQYNVITNRLLAHLHFYFEDGSSIEPAFTYDFRLWPLADVREAMLEAGFSNARILWEREDEDGDGTGVWYEPDYVENQLTWWTYVVGER